MPSLPNGTHVLIPDPWDGGARRTGTIIHPVSHDHGYVVSTLSPLGVATAVTFQRHEIITMGDTVDSRVPINSGRRVNVLDVPADVLVDPGGDKTAFDDAWPEGEIPPGLPQIVAAIDKAREAIVAAVGHFPQTDLAPAIDQLAADMKLLAAATQLPPATEVHHIDGDPTNNEPDNLAVRPATDLGVADSRALDQIHNILHDDTIGLMQTKLDRIVDAVHAVRPRS